MYEIPEEPIYFAMTTPQERLKNLEEALALCASPKNTESPAKVATAFEVSASTVKRRLAGGRSRAEAAIASRLLTERQEYVLESHIIFLSQMNCPPTGKAVRKLAAQMSGSGSESASHNWLKGFISRSQFLEQTRVGKIDLPRVRKNPKRLIDLFFDLYDYYRTKFSVDRDDIWNLDECGVKIGETMNKCTVVAHRNTRNIVTMDSGELVTVLELISAKGTVGTPLFIYKGVHFMESWFPRKIGSPVHVGATYSAFINSDIFLQWFREGTSCLDINPDKWKILLLDGHKTHTTTDFFDNAISRKIIPLFFPAHMTHILQPLDASTFGTLKKHVRMAYYEKFCQGWTPSKRNFFETYMGVRDQVYTSRGIKGAFRMTGIVPPNRELAKERATPLELPSESTPPPTVVTELEITEVREVSGDESQAVEIANNVRPNLLDTTWRSARASLLGMKCPSGCLEKYKEAWEEVQSLRAEVVVWKEKSGRYENQLGEELSKQNRKRPRIPNPNGGAILALGPKIDADCPITVDEISENSDVPT